MTKEEFRLNIKAHFPGKVNFVQFELYKRIIMEANKEMNLTGFKKEEDIYSKFFFDSLLPYAGLDLNGKEVLDIGTGAGVPGLLLKMVFPSAKITLMESQTKRCVFLEATIKVLEMNDIIIKNKRAEDITEWEREKYDVVTSRAVSELRKILEVSAPYAKVGGILIEPKSLGVDKEIVDSKGAIDRLFLKMTKIVQKNTPTMTHNIIFFEKYEPTISRYPRPWARIDSRPLIPFRQEEWDAYKKRKIDLDKKMQGIIEYDENDFTTEVKDE